MLLSPSPKPVGPWPGVMGAARPRLLLGRLGDVSGLRQSLASSSSPGHLQRQVSGDCSSSTRLDADSVLPVTDAESSILLLLSIGPIRAPSAEHHRFADVADCVYSSALAGIFSLKAHTKPNKEERRAMQNPRYLPTPVTKLTVAYSPVLWPI